jgi:arylsulfatase
MKRFSPLLRALLAGLLLAVPAAGATAAATPAKPLNLVILLADDWRFDTLGAANNPIVKTPRLDELATRGMRFSHACVTTSICGVSRASILTGQWMSRHGNRAFDSIQTPWNQTLPGILRDNGYFVGHVGKWHCGPFPAEKFDFARAYSGRFWMKRPDGSDVHVTRRNQEDALEFLVTRPPAKPFFLTVAFSAPHAEDQNPDQYLPQPESMGLYEEVEIPRPPLATDEALHNLPPFLQQARNEGRVRFHWRFDTPEKFQRMMKNYYRLCSEVDATCGRILDELAATGLLDTTLVVFIGDNGYYHGDRGLADKWYPHQESIRVPLIIHDPRIPAAARGTANDSLVLNVDLAPTLLAAAGLQAPAGMQGRDFATLYQPGGGRPNWRSEFLYEHSTIDTKERIPSSNAVVRKDVKYVHWPEFAYEELFDLTADPLEQVNLAKNPAHAEQLDMLRARLKVLMDEAR